MPVEIHQDELHRILSKTPSLKKLPANICGTDWFVGDVHGQLQMLELGLKAAKFEPAVDRLIGVGDLVDRGQKSFDVLKLFATSTWAHCAIGNHEVMALRGLVGKTSGYLSREAWRTSLTADGQRKVIEYISKFPLALEVPLSDGRRVGVVHAELPPLAPWASVEAAKFSDREFHDDTERNLLSCLLWSRRHFTLAEIARHDPECKFNARTDRLRASILLGPVQGIDLVIAGHSNSQVSHEPLHVSNRLFIDTGAGSKDGRLTLVNPRDRMYVQVTQDDWQMCRLPHPQDMSKFVLSKQDVDREIAVLKAQKWFEEFLYQYD